MLKSKDLVHRIELQITLYKSFILVWVFCSYIDDNTGKAVIKKYSSLENAVVDDVRTFCCSVHVLFQLCFKRLPRPFECVCYLLWLVVGKNSR